jgi:hypothetical protein
MSLGGTGHDKQRDKEVERRELCTARNGARPVTGTLGQGEVCVYAHVYGGRV